MSNRDRARDAQRALAAVVLYSALWIAVAASAGSAGGPSADARAGRRLLASASMVDTAIVVLLAPLFTLGAFPLGCGDRRRVMPPPSDLRAVARVVTEHLAGPAGIALAFGVASAAPLAVALALWGGGSLRDVIVTRAALLALACGLLSVGLFCSSLVRDVHDGAGLLYLVLLLLVGAVIFAGPLIARLSDAGALIQLVLLVNPFVGVAAAIDFDLVRTDGLYHWSPIGRRLFEYPPWQAVSGFYATVGALCFFGTVWRLARFEPNPIG